MEDGKLKIKTVSDSPEIRNLSDEALKAASMQDSASESDDGTTTVQTNLSTTSSVGTASNSHDNSHKNSHKNSCTREMCCVVYVTFA